MLRRKSKPESEHVFDVLQAQVDLANAQQRLTQPTQQPANCPPSACRSIEPAAAGGYFRC
ncbi:MAG: hypothetical protein HC895_04880 [Leptolyngbyaceae cyanobacterium SM1_3_5]|nr:hypothetical protein [Leptolyngbyaceae cyanobacterium SM1_3_5]